MADDWLTAGEPEADDDWLTEGVAPKSGKEPPSAGEPETGAAGGGGDGDDEDWLASSVEYTAAEVLYGSPCGFAVPLGHTYWCDQSQRLISEQVCPRAQPQRVDSQPLTCFCLRSVPRRRSTPSSRLTATRSTASSRRKCLRTSAQQLIAQRPLHVL